MTGLRAYGEIEPRSIQLSENFEVHIDLHRQVREYNRQMKEREEAYRRKVMIGGSVLLLASAGLAYFVKKKYFHA